ncbi:unnamed protein product [Didymodactylos carnosus]|nr:unnamed protein product [Didymodactylos carnosus]CAF3565377.1 unnamed protein product [Didymodactylos carnosus]
MYELICLGVGKGATAVYNNKTSSSFAIRNKTNGECVLIIDMGLGSLYSFQQYFPPNTRIKNVYISHNHTDHSGELPVYIANEAPKVTDSSSKLKIFSHKDVLQRLQQHRCHELYSATIDYFKNVCWMPCEENQMISLDENGSLCLKVARSQHNELCYGFVLYCQNKPILSFSGDSGFNQNFFHFLYTAPVILVDGRDKGTYEHAGFDEIFNFHQSSPVKDSQTVYVYHYGLENEAPSFQISAIKAIRPGDIVSLSTLQDGQD